jgi:hydrogenase expression/formation protein HypE
MKRFDRILLGHGAGGRLTQDLVRDVFLPRFDNPALAGLSDAALLDALPAGRPALTTDGFVVDPPVFPGGDLGYLSVCGTVNDLAVAGARPLWLTFALILEEGCEESLVLTIAEGAARAAEEAGVQIVAGDTKVVPKGKGDRVYAVTTGLGVSPPERDLGDHRIVPGDVVIVSGPLADHGATVMACRHGLEGQGLRSDCMPLASLADALLECGAEVHSMHDPTRGGLGTVCSEVADRAGLRIALEESLLPVRPEVVGVCELLGLEPLHLASEGRLVTFVRDEDADKALACMRGHPGGREAVRVGRVEERIEGAAPVALRTAIGGERPVDLLSGANLPRIC